MKNDQKSKHHKTFKLPQNTRSPENYKPIPQDSGHNTLKQLASQLLQRIKNCVSFQIR